MPQSLIKKLLGEAQQDMRFDLNARVEVWVSAEDLEQDERIQALRQDPRPAADKVAEAKAAAVELAHKKIRTVTNGDFDIEADVSLESVNVDRIDWTELVSPVAEEGSEV